MMKNIQSANLTDKRVLIRCDFNVPVQNGKITDDARIQRSLQTITYCVKHAKQVVLVSHLGRPKGIDKTFSLKPVQETLEKLLNEKVRLIENIEQVDDKIVLVENIRFFQGEKENSTDFSKQLASLCDIYVNDAFGTAHRAHASNSGIKQFVPSYIGFLMNEEITQLSKVLNPEKPLVSILGFAKISDKIQTVQTLFEKSNHILLGGAVIFTFLKAKGIEIGKSLVEDEQIETVKKLINSYEEKIVYPVDFMCAHSFDGEPALFDEVPADRMGLDIGPKSVSLFETYLNGAKTIFWNGPVGVFEKKPYDTATNALGVIIEKTNATSIIGGGDTASALKEYKMSHKSTGGGASIEFLSGKTLASLR